MPFSLSNANFPQSISHNLLITDTKHATELTMGRENSEWENGFPRGNRGTAAGHFATNPGISPTLHASSRCHIVHVVSVSLSNVIFPQFIFHNLFITNTKHATELTIGRDKPSRKTIRKGYRELRDEYQDNTSSRVSVFQVASVSWSNVSIPLSLSHNMLLINPKHATELINARPKSERHRSQGDQGQESSPAPARHSRRKGVLH